jgi:hypothetical protein
LGDLGELLALLHALAHLGYNPALVLPKNALKIFERKSESGIDVLCFEMTLEADETGPLPEDRALIIESKVGPDSPYRSLAREAADYFDSVSAHQWQRELLLAQSSLRSRGAPAPAARLKYFLPGWPAHESVDRLAFLVSKRSADEPLDVSPLDSTSNCTAAAMPLATDACVERAFMYRRRV